MSYHTKVDMSFHGGVFRGKSCPDPMALIKARVEEFRQLDRLAHPDEFDEFFLDEIEKAFESTDGEEIVIAGHNPYIPIQRLLVFLSQSFEDASFAARGWGEEYWDVWFFEYKNGELKTSTMPADVNSPASTSRVEGYFTKAIDPVSGRQVYLRPEFKKKAVIFLLAVIIIGVATVFALEHE